MYAYDAKSEPKEYDRVKESKQKSEERIGERVKLGKQKSDELLKMISENNKIISKKSFSFSKFV